MNPVVLQQRFDPVGMGCDTTLETTQAMVAVAQHAQHGHHALDGRNHGLRHCLVICEKGVPDRDHVQQAIKQFRRIARCVATIWQNNLIDDCAKPGMGVFTQRAGCAERDARILQCQRLQKLMSRKGRTPRGHAFYLLFDQGIERRFET